MKKFSYAAAANELKPLRRIFEKFEDMGVVLEKASTAEADLAAMTKEYDRVKADLEEIQKSLDEKIAESRETLASAKQEEFAYQEHVVAARKRLDDDMVRRQAEHDQALVDIDDVAEQLAENHADIAAVYAAELWDATYDLAHAVNAHKDFLASLKA